MRRLLILTVAGMMAAQPALARGGHGHGGHSGHTGTGSGATTATQPSTSVTTSTNTTTGVTTTTATATGGTPVGSGGSNNDHGRDRHNGRNALDRARARAADEQTEERYDDRYFNAARERQKEIDRASNPAYTGPSAAAHTNAIQYGAQSSTDTEETHRGAFEQRVRTGPFEGENTDLGH